MKKLALGLLLGPFFFLSGCLWVIPKYKAHPPIAQYQGELKLKGLEKKVDIYRDQYGVPNIFAANEHDLFLSVGYLQAQDRLWEMTFLRAMMAGRTSEVLGKLNVPGVSLKGFPLNTVEIDRQIRTYGMNYLGLVGEALLKEYDPEVYVMLTAYCDGINSWISAHPDYNQLPIEFQVLKVKPEPWRPADVLSIAKFQGFTLGYNMLAEVLRYGLQVKYGQDLAWTVAMVHGAPGPTIVPPELLKNKLKTPRDLTPGGRLTDEQIGYQLPLSADAALDFYKIETARRQATFSDNPFASNSWLISPKISENGHALLANDPHQPHMEPSVWYMMHLNCPGVDVFGAAFPGTPFPALGHTRKLAWSATTSIADAQDLFIETTDASHPNMYKYKGEWIPFTVRKEKIRIRKGNKFEEMGIEIKQSIHGPIITDNLPLPAGTPPMAFRWTGWDFSRNQKMFSALVGSTSVEEFMDKVRAMPAKERELTMTAIAVKYLMRGESVQDFIQAMDKVEVPSQNWSAADADGHIIYLPGGLVPIRNKGYGVMPAPGESGEFDWTGFIPTMELPWTMDPERGYMATANNEVVDAEWYPYIFDLNYDAGWRAWRIEELIKELKPISMDDMATIQNDIYSKQAEYYMPIILKAVENKKVTDKDVLKAYQILKSWNLQTSLDQNGPTIFYDFLVKMRKNILGDEVSEEDFKTFLSASHIDMVTDLLITKPEAKVWDDQRTKDIVEDRDDIIVRTLKDSMTFLQKKYGQDPGNWEWGDVHYIRFFHILGFGPLHDLGVGKWPVPGSRHTVRCESPADSGKDPFKSMNGTSWRHLVDMKDVENAQVVIDGSVSGQWLSPHYDDLVQVWLKGEYIAAPMEKDAVIKGAKYHMVLLP